MSFQKSRADNPENWQAEQQALDYIGITARSSHQDTVCVHVGINIG